MDYDEIKTELIKKSEELLRRKYPKANVSGFEKLDAIQKNLSRVEDYADEVTAILNKILDENKIILEDGEKEKFINYIKPTMNELIVKFTKNAFE